MTILTRQADLAHVLADCGVVVTLGAASTFGTVRSADGEVLRADGSPVALRPHAILVTIQTSTLAGLHEGSQITVAGSPYVVDSLHRPGDGETVRLLVSPVVGAIVAAPAAVADLAVTCDLTYPGPDLLPIVLAWTVPGEAAQWGTPSEYDVRVALAAIVTEEDWAVAGSCTEGWFANPLLGGMVAALNYTGWSPGVEYFFAVRYRDALGNVGAISNCPSLSVGRPS
jgi:hypothetical protein